MAISRVTTWTTNQVLTSTALNGEFNNILNNALSLVSPWTGNMDAGGFRLITLNLGSVGDPAVRFTGDADTGIYSSAANTLDVATAGVRAASFGASFLLAASPEDSRTTTIDVVGELRSTTSGTPASGIGTGLLFSAESADENPCNIGELDFNLEDVGAGTEDSVFDILLRVAGAALTSSYRFRSLDTFLATITRTLTAARTYTLPDLTGTVALTSGAQTFTDKTLTAPVLSGTATGTYTLGGTPTITAPTIADFTNAAHDHGDADDAGAIVGGMDTTRRTTDFTTTSTSFVDVTTHSITITTRARRVLLTFSGSVQNGTSASNAFTFDIDGTDAGGADGLVDVITASLNSNYDCSMTYLTDVLTAASHTFKVNMKVSAGTGNLVGAANNTFSAIEMPY